MLDDEIAELKAEIERLQAERAKQKRRYEELIEKWRTSAREGRSRVRPMSALGQKRTC
jgi:septal ring factor EnvC (AmiA/AmiB activator)